MVKDKIWTCCSNYDSATKIVPLLKAIVWQLCCRYFSSAFSFCKVTINENISFTDYASGIQLPDCSKLAINQENDNDNFLTWHHCQILLQGFVSLVKFSYWSNFHVNIITGSGVMTIFFYKGLARNPEIPPLGSAQYLETGAS